MVSPSDVEAARGDASIGTPAPWESTFVPTYIAPTVDEERVTQFKKIIETVKGDDDALSCARDALYDATGLSQLTDYGQAYQTHYNNMATLAPIVKPLIPDMGPLRIPRGTFLRLVTLG